MLLPAFPAELNDMGRAKARVMDCACSPLLNGPWERVLILRVGNGVNCDCDYDLHAPLLLLFRLAEEARIEREWGKGKAGRKIRVGRAWRRARHRRRCLRSGAPDLIGWQVSIDGNIQLRGRRFSVPGHLPYAGVVGVGMNGRPFLHPE